jgi:hypothetical protein
MKHERLNKHPKRMLKDDARPVYANSVNMHITLRCKADHGSAVRDMLMHKLQTFAALNEGVSIIDLNTGKDILE